MWIRHGTVVMGLTSMLRKHFFFVWLFGQCLGRLLTRTLKKKQGFVNGVTAATSLGELSRGKTEMVWREPGEKLGERELEGEMETAKSERSRVGKKLKGRAPEQWSGRGEWLEMKLGWAGIMKNLTGQVKLCPKGNGKPLTGLTEEWHDQIFIFKRFAGFSVENSQKRVRVTMGKLLEDRWSNLLRKHIQKASCTVCLLAWRIVGGASLSPHRRAQKTRDTAESLSTNHSLTGLGEATPTGRQWVETTPSSSLLVKSKYKSNSEWSEEVAPESAVKGHIWWIWDLRLHDEPA